jgi:hypothetical protein
MTDVAGVVDDPPPCGTGAREAAEGVSRLKGHPTGVRATLRDRVPCGVVCVSSKRQVGMAWPCSQSHANVSGCPLVPAWAADPLPVVVAGGVALVVEGRSVVCGAGVAWGVEGALVACGVVLVDVGAGAVAPVVSVMPVVPVVFCGVTAGVAVLVVVVPPLLMLGLDEDEPLPVEGVAVAGDELSWLVEGVDFVVVERVCPTASPGSRSTRRLRDQKT